MRRGMLAGLTAALVFLTPLATRVGAEAPRYSIQDLGTLDGFVPNVTGVNASGEASGWIFGSAGQRAVRYRDGVWSYVPGLENVTSVAFAINDHGDLTGWHISAQGMRAYRYLANTGTIEVIPALPGGTMTVGWAINNNGYVAGQANTAAGGRAFRAAPGLPPVELPTLGGFANSACGINDEGQVAGVASTPEGFQHAVRVDADGSITDLGTFDGAGGTGFACGIDRAGHVAGRATNGGVFHAFRFVGGLVDINVFGAASSSAEATSNGTTVGYFSFPGDFTTRAFVHTASDGAVDLNSRIPADSGWQLSQAKGVNANGQIVGMGVLPTGESRPFLLTPLVPPDTEAPAIASVLVTPSSIVPPNKAMVGVNVSVSVTDNRDPAPVCFISGVDGHGAPASDFAVTGLFSGSVRAVGGRTYSFVVKCADAAGNESFGSGDVVVPPDTTGPAFTSLTVNPSTIWPPKNQMVTVTVAMSAIDDSGDAPSCRLGTITTNGGAPDADLVVTSATTGSVRAVGGRTYSFNAVCTDGSGNSSWASTNVTVARDTTAPVITGLSASPYVIWPPNGKMVPVSVSVSATDDVDGMPACAISSIAASELAPSDAVITGNFSAQVRAKRDDDGSDRVYTIHVICRDTAGNQSEKVVDVTVTKDGNGPTKMKNASNKRDRYTLARRAAKELLLALLHSNKGRG